MIKMYRAEVLGKLPVVQHFLFGTFLPYDGPVLANLDTEEAGYNEQCGHAHAHMHDSSNPLGPGQRQQGWGDCCGIPVPSVFAAAEAEKRAGPRLEGPAIRPVPFD